MEFNSLLKLTDEQFENLAPSIIDDIENRSVFFEAHKKQSIPNLKSSDLVVGNSLGEGGFCTVYELLSIKDTEIKDTDDLLSPLLDQMQNGNSSPFVVKKIKDTAKNRTHTSAFIDLSCEVKFLSTLSHPNIIKVRGISKDEEEVLSCVILDRLYLRLDEQLKFWTRRVKSASGIFGLSFCGSNPDTVKKLLLERVFVAYYLSSALKYLHRYRLVYRDIKPHNIGFDEKGVVKIYDFGLCKELREQYLVTDNNDIKLYKLTEFAGSLPYMAPEIYFGEHYNCLADVYSFGMLLYQIICLKPLFPKLGPFDLDRKVYKSELRPKIKRDVCSARVTDIMQRSWANKISARPAMSEIYSLLKVEIADLKSPTKSIK